MVEKLLLILRLLMNADLAISTHLECPTLRVKLRSVGLDILS
jgi:hypothetical protein